MDEENVILNESLKTIADFMGYDYVEIGYTGTDSETEWQRSNAERMDLLGMESIGEFCINRDNTGFFDFSDCAYQKSWDWLMPVVIACETLATEKINELANGPFEIDDPKSWRAWDYRRVRLSSNIDETYKQVVAFIEWCNKAKANG